MNFTNILNSIKTKADFINFIHFLLEDLKNNSEDWENKTLPEFLEAIAGWTDDMEGYYINNDLPIPDNVDWKLFADILVAAKMYE